ncbi:hypothetical protein [Paraburkholderia phosphatilytica]|uniref:hypothetical protein n=1 Tax=Paraburkholderia phosphatilytica TaxID=2282883 RepID=UPI0013DE7E0E|nr:hypothetical protein [Paraburkholderia phosphatilytica]
MALAPPRCRPGFGQHRSIAVLMVTRGEQPERIDSRAASHATRGIACRAPRGAVQSMRYPGIQGSLHPADPAYDRLIRLDARLDAQVDKQLDKRLNERC